MMTLAMHIPNKHESAMYQGSAAHASFHVLVCLCMSLCQCTGCGNSRPLYLIVCSSGSLPCMHPAERPLTILEMQSDIVRQHNSIAICALEASFMLTS